MLPEQEETEDMSEADMEDGIGDLEKFEQIM
jgi:hypothetical protein